jgi:predicted dehydrogenase
MAAAEESQYGIGDTGSGAKVAAPDLPYHPPAPLAYRPAIGLVGCGGIAEMHLKAYKKAGYNVVALCSRNQERLHARQREFFPEADVYTDYRQLIERDDIEVVDLTPHPPDRLPMMDLALECGKHVLSQKPFVVDLDEGERLVAKAAANGLRLAVNQNGRWAPHFSYMRQAVKAGLIGRINSIDLSVHWDHGWIAATPFNEVEHLILYDFGIHWFDMVNAFMGERRALSVYATEARAAGQQAKPPFLAQVAIAYEDAQATLVFNAATVAGQEDRSVVSGSAGTLASVGLDLQAQEVTLDTEAGRARPALQGTWFEEGFHGAMAELLCAVEAGREPDNGAKTNLKSLELCFAAVSSAQKGVPVEVGGVRRLSVR